VTLNTLSSSRENFAAAAGRIMDADVAEESAALTRTQILQQAGAAVLSQANQQPALALQLLRG
jgi:flagellin